MTTPAHRRGLLYLLFLLGLVFLALLAAVVFVSASPAVASILAGQRGEMAEAMVEAASRFYSKTDGNVVSQGDPSRIPDKPGKTSWAKITLANLKACEKRWEDGGVQNSNEALDWLIGEADRRVEAAKAKERSAVRFGRN